jgi:uncharacterized protein YggU (UPF0235/DUF167 family)
VIEIVDRHGANTIMMRVIPRASRDAIEGAYGDSLKERWIAPALENRANEALRRLLAARLNVRVAAVRIVAGEKSRTKRISIAGTTREQIIQKLGL